jgi:DNA-directed RNA polymerase specialized sigma24 family protein
MSLLSRYDGIEPYAVRTAIYFADKLIQGSYFNQADREDIVQELILHYLLKAKEYDKSRSAVGTFIFECMQNYAISLLRIKKRQITESF